MTANTVSKPHLLAKVEKDKGHRFSVPSKRINDGQDVSHFLSSRAYGDLMTFLLQLDRAVFPSTIKESNQKVDVRFWLLNSSDLVFSEPVHKIRQLLLHLESLIEEYPPHEGPRRFGNVSFRKWYQGVEGRASDLLRHHLPSLPIEAVTPGPSIEEELLPYFFGSFGSAQRLDYGSGHELSFFAFLGCIWKLGGFEGSEENESRGIVLGILPEYFRLIRRLIKTYTLEPAGSHGVWGLDDHSFLPYIFGSAQNGPPISDNDPIPTEGSRRGAPNPADVSKANLVEKHRDQDLYFGAVGFIYDVKKGPFWEHSPMLYDISGVQAGWGKINKVRCLNLCCPVPSPHIFTIPFRLMGGSISGYDQNVRRRSSRQVSGRPTLPLRLPLQLGDRPASPAAASLCTHIQPARVYLLSNGEHIIDASHRDTDAESHRTWFDEGPMGSQPAES